MKPRILIVDDDVAITQQLFWMLCDDYEVMTANDMQTAFRRATIYEPALSIVDLHLPPSADTPEAGLRVLEYIKERFPNSKVIIISSSVTMEVQKACLRGGAEVVLPKPFKAEDLLALMSRHAPRQSFGMLN
jgi:CheY-like chemotaxis protein